MIAPERTLLVLLAAGRSERFGAVDKLAADWRGMPLGLHAVTALAGLPFLGRLAVIAQTSIDFAAHGYRTVVNSAPGRGMSTSVALGVAAAEDASAAAMLVVLADMPCITPEHVMRLMEAADSTDAVVASSNGSVPSPPALFAAGRFPDLAAAKGDSGGRGLLRHAVHIVADTGELVDIDTPEDLDRLRARR